MTQKAPSGFKLLVAAALALVAFEPIGHPNVYSPIDSSYKLIFDDEFNGTTLDTNAWLPNYRGTSNTETTPPVTPNELQCYDPKQVTVSGGHLNLTAIRGSCIEEVHGKTYSYKSGIVMSTTTYLYGYFEARVFLPASSQGILANWPAWWLTNFTYAWPIGGEIDVVEGLEGRAGSTYHWGALSNPRKNNAMSTTDFTGWHVYGVLWQPGSIQFYYDGKLQHTVTVAVTSSAMTLILNNAIGGFGGPTVVPSVMMVDYVHVYSNAPSAVAVSPQTGYGRPGDTGPAIQ